MTQNGCRIPALPVLAALPVLLFASAQSQAQMLSAAAGCGADQVHFHTKHDKHAQPPQSDPARATVYFIEDDSSFNMLPQPTTRIGIDGQWVGATHEDSWYAFQIAPGVHHLCAAWQGEGDQGSPLITSAFAGYPSQATAMVFNAQPGAVYYFLDKNLYDAHDQSHTHAKVGLTLIDNTQAAALLARRPFTVPKSSTGDRALLDGSAGEKK